MIGILPRPLCAPAFPALPDADVAWCRPSPRCPGPFPCRATSRYERRCSDASLQIMLSCGDRPTRPPASSRARTPRGAPTDARLLNFARDEHRPFTPTSENFVIAPCGAGAPPPSPSAAASMPLRLCEVLALGRLSCSTLWTPQPRPHDRPCRCRCDPNPCLSWTTASAAALPSSHPCLGNANVSATDSAPPLKTVAYDRRPGRQSATPAWANRPAPDPFRRALCHCDQLARARAPAPATVPPPPPEQCTP